MTKEDRINLIIEYAKKVLQYPKGNKGYSPVDAMNLENSIKKYEEEYINL